MVCGTYCSFAKSFISLSARTANNPQVKNYYTAGVRTRRVSPAPSIFAKKIFLTSVMRGKQAKWFCKAHKNKRARYKRARAAVSLCDQDTTTNEYKFCFLRTQQIAVFYSRCLGLQNDLCLNFCTKQMRHEKGFLRLYQRSEIRILSFFMYQGSGPLLIMPNLHITYHFMRGNFQIGQETYDMERYEN
jgi:hypothetical protein